MDGGQQGPKTDIGWEVWPKALYDMVMRITRDYNRPVIEITESGCAYNDGPDASGEIRDSRRIEYHREYLAALGTLHCAKAPTFADITPGACWIISSGRKGSASVSAGLRGFQDAAADDEGFRTVVCEGGGGESGWLSAGAGGKLQGPFRPPD